ncbi:hypothetical protein BH10ACI1_BH10ACI1_16050 [soil metagenome]
MRTIFAALIMMLAFGFGFSADAQNTERVQLRVGKQKTVTTDKIKIKFVSLIEDSRCPEGTQCVWAGNAKIKIKVTNKAGKSEFFEINTNAGVRGATFGGYAINLEELTPSPKVNVRINRYQYTATFSISRLTR